MLDSNRRVTTMKKYWLASAAALIVSASVNVAHAEEGFTWNKPQVGAALGYGIWTGDGDINPYGFDLGLHGGYTLDMGLYVGGRFEYFLGESQGNSNFGIWNLMAEGGYDIGIGENMVIRPQLGLGMANVHAKVCVAFLGPEQCFSNSDSYFSAAPGAFFMYSFGGPFIDAGLRFQHIFHDGTGSGDGLLLNVGGGMAF